MTLIEALEMIEAPLENAISSCLADGFNDGTLQQLEIAQKALYRALGLALESEFNWDAHDGEPEGSVIGDG